MSNTVRDSVSVSLPRLYLGSVESGLSLTQTPRLSHSDVTVSTHSVSLRVRLTESETVTVSDGVRLSLRLSEIVSE